MYKLRNQNAPIKAKDIRVIQNSPSGLKLSMLDDFEFKLYNQIKSLVDGQYYYTTTRGDIDVTITTKANKDISYVGPDGIQKYFVDIDADSRIKSFEEETIIKYLLDDTKQQIKFWPPVTKPVVKTLAVKPPVIKPVVNEAIITKTTLTVNDDYRLVVPQDARIDVLSLTMDQNDLLTSALTLDDGQYTYQKSDVNVTLFVKTVNNYKFISFIDEDEKLKYFVHLQLDPRFSFYKKMNNQIILYDAKKQVLQMWQK